MIWKRFHSIAKNSTRNLQFNKCCTRCPKRSFSLLAFIQVENDCIYTFCFYIFWVLLILQLKVWYKSVQNQLKVRQGMATKSWNFRTRWWQTTQSFSKNALIQSSHFSIPKVNWNIKTSWNWKRQLFYFVIKLTKPFSARDEKLREVSVSYFLWR